MTHFIRINKASVAVHGAEACSLLQSLVDESCLIEQPEHFDLELRYHLDGIQLSWNKDGGKPINFHLDYLKFVSKIRSFPAPKQGAFNQALGKKTQRVIDATGGWGGDALLMCTQGYEVVIFERQLIMATLMREAFKRLAKSEWALRNDVRIPQVKHADAISDLNYLLYPSDCVYLDPMFPSKRKKSAASNKRMQLLQWLVGEDTDASELALSAVAAGYPRVAIKRPDYAAPLVEKPDAQFSSKLLHYDVYLSA